MKKIISLIFICSLIFSSICLADIKTLSQSNIWNSTFNDQNNQFIISGNENNAKVSLILTPNQPAYLQIIFPQAGYNFDDNTIVTLSINNYNIKLTKDLSNTNSQICVFQYTFKNNELKAFVHELTSKKEADIELNDRMTSITLNGTSRSISAVLKYIEDNLIASFPEPFHIDNVIPTETPTIPITDHNNTSQPQSVKPDYSQENTNDKSNDNKLLYNIGYLVACILIYKYIIKPIIQYRKRKKQDQYHKDQMIYALTVCKNEIQDQAQKLYIKREQLIYYDDYGTVKNEKWIREIDTFINSRIYPLLLKNDLEMYFTYLKDNIIELINIAANTKQEISPEVREQLAQSTDFYHPSMNPFDYEVFCAKELRKVGWEATATQASGDQGADVIATKNGITLILQCKLYSKPVGNTAVQEINTAKTFYHANYAAVVSNASYTTSARQIASSTKTALLHHDELQTYATSLINN
ncbi:restriction endonuclease [Commensalibacter communis]|uniref:restriction endonuclease n=1 Tax=Commensalibacter communis TaxID=2972786 RepID=UPI0022FF6A85|nr:restriction endonuclease [Commensalibacter communis]CAI3933281.1 Endonuclease [Commensalibacter communis]CAI3944912.1 Endonuclease [Commensalibacter communis]